MTLDGTGFSHDPASMDCPCAQCETNAVIVRYLMFHLDPTDRAVRPAGNLYPAEAAAT